MRLEAEILNLRYDGDFGLGVEVDNTLIVPLDEILDEVEHGNEQHCLEERDAVGWEHEAEERHVKNVLESADHEHEVQRVLAGAESLQYHDREQHPHKIVYAVI